MDPIWEGFVARLGELGVTPNRARVAVVSGENGAVAPEDVALGIEKERPDVVVSISEPLADAVVARFHGRVPLVLLAISERFTLRYTETLANRPGSGVTGVVDHCRALEQLRALRRLVPAVRRVGVLYDPIFPPAELPTEAARSLGLDLDVRAARTAEQVREQLRLFEERRIQALWVNAIYASDHSVFEGFPEIAEHARARRLPLVTDTWVNLRRGALVARTSSAPEAGRVGAERVASLLAGADPGTLPVHALGCGPILVNGETARRIGVEIPEALRGEASVLGDAKVE